ncbi:MAG: aspartate aminotransferase family protein [Calditrichaeota bacterium]|nr:aspartate aminotransferase family protein [Calditrichota bacterium]
MNPSKDDIFDLFSRYVSSGKTRFFREAGIDFVFGKREGPFVWDIDGKRRLIDCHCNGGVFNLGHRHPEIVELLRDALSRVDIGNHHFVSQYRAQLAEKLAALTPGNLQYTIFGVSGGEAIDTAIKIARGATGRRKILSVKGAYHGHTGLAVATGDAKYSQPFLSDSPDFVQVPFNDVAALTQTLTEEFAAVILETIPATLGMPIPDSDYFQKVHQVCRQRGSLLIIDEVQSGLGRTGKLWAISHFDTVPDILVTGKGLSGGLYPITATIIRPELEILFQDDPFIHISTFGGSELGCLVASKVLDITRQREFLEHVNRLANIFADGLDTLRQRFEGFLVDVRQKGLMIGLKMADERLGPVMTRACFETGLLCVFAGNDTSVVQFLPPLIIDETLAQEILQRLHQAFQIGQEFISS